MQQKQHQHNFKSKETCSHKDSENQKLQEPQPRQAQQRRKRRNSKRKQPYKYRKEALKPRGTGAVAITSGKSEHVDKFNKHTSNTTITQYNGNDDRNHSEHNSITRAPGQKRTPNKPNEQTSKDNQTSQRIEVTGP